VMLSSLLNKLVLHVVNIILRDVRYDHFDIAILIFTHCCIHSCIHIHVYECIYVPCVLHWRMVAIRDVACHDSLSAFCHIVALVNIC
jgi:hypothetical protein